MRRGGYAGTCGRAEGEAPGDAEGLSEATSGGCCGLAGRLDYRRREKEGRTLAYSAGSCRIGRLASSVPACLLALALILAQPASCLAWLDGAHATLEQAVLHAEALDSGDHHHHGGSRRGAEVASKGTTAVYLDASTPEVGPTAAFAELPPDLLKGTLLPAPGFPGGRDASLLVFTAPALEGQHSPPVPHRPPIPRS